MESRFDFIEIEITDFVEDSVDDAAFAINFQINGPGDLVEYLRVSFADEFVEEYFHVRWSQDLAAAEKKILREHHPLFIRWGVFIVEKWLDGGRVEKNIRIEGGPASIWTHKVAQGLLKPKSEAKGDRLFVYTMERKKP
ncbi:MAG: hypothetical protein ACOY3K_04830 [Candidatus Omnitrophota bacterium]